MGVDPTIKAIFDALEEFITLYGKFTMESILGLFMIFIWRAMRGDNRNREKSNEEAAKQNSLRDQRADELVRTVNLTQQRMIEMQSEFISTSRKSSEAFLEQIDGHQKALNNFTKVVETFSAITTNSIKQETEKVSLKIAEAAERSTKENAAIIERIIMHISTSNESIMTSNADISKALNSLLAETRNSNAQFRELLNMKEKENANDGKVDNVISVSGIDRGVSSDITIHQSGNP